MLAATVDAGEWLFVQQADHAVFQGDLLHDLHGQLVVVGRHVHGGEDGRELVLRRRHLVMLGLRQDSELPQLAVQVLHVRGHAGLDNAEVVVFHLLAFGGAGAEEGSAREAQVVSLVEQLLVY